MLIKMDPKLTINHLQVIRYMGSKRNILRRIVPIIHSNIDEKRLFFDMFAGTNSVSYALKTCNGGNLGIITNDTQKYSYVIAKALIENNKIQQISLDEAKSDLMKNFESNMKFIKKTWSNRFIRNHQYRTKEDDDRKESFSDFIKKEISEILFCLFTFYFSDIYFSLQQCKEIDSLRFAIEQIEDETKKNIYLTCLLYAVSYGSSTFGHFAQPRRVTDEVLEIRNKSILILFLKKLNGLFIQKNNKESFCFNEDYKNLVNQQKFRRFKKKIGFVYIDPPYSEANYSRFYHILETLVRYDYPVNEYKGLYRDNRFKSGFCKPTKVEEEFRNVLQFAAAADAHAMISYINSGVGLLSKKKLVSLCKEIFGSNNVTVFPDISHIHSTLGNKTKNSVKEILILCGK